MAKMITVKAKKWGNSLGFIVPKEIVAELHIRDNDIITIQIQSENSLRKLQNANLGITRDDVSQAKKDLVSKYD